MQNGHWVSPGRPANLPIQAASFGRILSSEVSRDKRLQKLNAWLCILPLAWLAVRPTMPGHFPSQSLSACSIYKMKTLSTCRVSRWEITTRIQKVPSMTAVISWSGNMTLIFKVVGTRVYCCALSFYLKSSLPESWQRRMGCFRPGKCPGYMQIVKQGDNHHSVKCCVRAVLSTFLRISFFFFFFLPAFPACQKSKTRFENWQKGEKVRTWPFWGQGRELGGCDGVLNGEVRRPSKQTFLHQYVGRVCILVVFAFSFPLPLIIFHVRARSPGFQGWNGCWFSFWPCLSAFPLHPCRAFSGFSHVIFPSASRSLRGPWIPFPSAHHLASSPHILIHAISPQEILP